MHGDAEDAQRGERLRCSRGSTRGWRLRVWEQRFSGVSAPNSRRCRGEAVAATNDVSAGAICNRRVTAAKREFGARGWALRTA